MPYNLVKVRTRVWFCLMLCSRIFFTFTYPVFTHLVLCSYDTFMGSREASAAGDEGDFDPFKRRSCRPKILWSVGQNSPTRPPSGGAAGSGGGAAGDGEAAGDKSASGSGAANGGADAAMTAKEKGVGAAAAAAAGKVKVEPGGGLQNMHSFGGIDIMEAGRAALEKRMNAVKTKAAPRQGGKLTLENYLEKARVDA